MSSAILVSSLSVTCGAQKPPVPEQDWASRPVIRVWNGPAPGSETDTRKGSVMHPPDSATLHLVRNVTVPTLTVFQPKEGNRSKTAVMICPGGAFRILAIDQEGYRTGQHGFSMTERGTSDHWLQELWWWMETFGLTPS